MLAPHLLAGGLAQQLLLLGVPPTWPTNRRRTAAVFSTVVILVVLMLLGVWGKILLPAVPGLLLYGLVLRLPRGDEPGGRR